MDVFLCVLRILFNKGDWFMYSAIKLNYDSLVPFISDDTLREHYNIYLGYVKKRAIVPLVLIASAFFVIIHVEL